jgi:hypothetical protein
MQWIGSCVSRNACVVVTWLVISQAKSVLVVAWNQHQQWCTYTIEYIYLINMMCSVSADPCTAWWMGSRVSRNAVCCDVAGDQSSQACSCWVAWHQSTVVYVQYEQI